jgi:integrase
MNIDDQISCKAIKHPTRYPSNKKGTQWSDFGLKNITANWEGDYVADGKGLTGEIKVVKNKIFIYFKYGYKISDKTTGKRVSKNFHCGTYPSESISEIRTNRDNALKLVKKGIDPQIHKIACKIEAQQEREKVIQNQEIADAENKTVEDLYNDWIQNGIARADNNANIKQTFSKHVIPVIGKITLRELTEDQLRNMFKKTIESGTKRTGAELISSVKQMFNWGDLGNPWRALMSNGNPSARIKAKNFPLLHKTVYKKERKRLLNPFEIWRLKNIFSTADIEYSKIESENKYKFIFPLKKEYQLAAWLCLSTLCRIGEVSKAKWEHIDIKKKNGEAKAFNKVTWFFPLENTKGKVQDHTVFLSDFSLSILKELHKLTGHTEWLFPSSKIKGKCITSKVITHRIRERQIQFSKPTTKKSVRLTDNALVLGTEKWFPHDLRRSGATMMQSLKTDREIINLCQNHIIGTQTDKSYLLHKQIEEQIKAWELLGERIDEIINSDIKDLDGFPILEFDEGIETESEDDESDGW